MKKILLISFCLSLIIASLHAQNLNKCGTMDYYASQKAADPTLESRMVEIERQTQQWIADHPNMRSASVITIPVVFHVVYNTASQNISDAQCQYQLDQLNLDYGRTNADAVNTPSVWQSVAANTQIQFCLAKRDPSGNATTGIIHKSTTTTSFSTNNNVKHSSSGGDDAWDRNSYLNLWVCNLGGGLLGYAQFPGGTASTDGVVVHYGSVGSAAHPSSFNWGAGTNYNWGRTTTHEVGHWLNLFHIWGDDGSACTGSDQVTDTPNQSSENYGCPSFPHTDNCSPSSPGVMYMNYMDYTDDDCMNMFTNGQSSRANAALNGTRASILSSLGCVPISGCADNYEPNNINADAVTIPLNTNVTGLISPGTDVDFFKFNNTVSQPNIKVMLTNLPANYQLKLLKNGVLASSNNSGTANETIIYNTSVVGNYKIKVVGVSGSNSSTQCYTLNAQISSTPFRLAAQEEIKGENLPVLSVYPNPVKDELNVQFNSSVEGSITIKVVDIVGQNVMNIQQQGIAGINNFKLKLSDLNKGIYFVDVNNGADREIRKIILDK
jgi:hypothetical protein